MSASGDLRLTAAAPHLAATEIVMKLSVRVPLTLFRKPALSAEIVVPAEAGSPERIEASTVSDIREAVRQATGMDLSITVVPPNAD